MKTREIGDEGIRWGEAMGAMGLGFAAMGCTMALFQVVWGVRWSLVAN